MRIGSRLAVGLALAAVAAACSDSKPENRPPRCAADAAVAIAGRALALPVLANDGDDDGDPLAVTTLSAPGHGTASLDPSGVVTYTAATGYRGSDAFTYAASDGRGGTCTGTASLTVHAIDNPSLHAFPAGWPATLAAAADTAGGLWVVWADALPAGIELRALRTTAALPPPAPDGVFISTISGPTAGGFMTPGVRVVPDAAGGIIVAWIDHLKTPPFHALFAQRIEISGQARWSAGGRPVCGRLERTPAFDAENHFDLLADGGGGAWVTWAAGPASDTTISVQHLAPDDGALDVGICGTTVTGDETGAVEPRLVPDGAGGAVATWWTVGGQPAAQRILPGGALAWGPDPVFLASTGYNSSVAPDGAGGALVAFAAGPYDDTNVRVQRVTAAGTLPWGTEGVAVVTTTGVQEFPRATSDGAGGAVVAWWDHRGHAYDVNTAPALYAQRVLADGGVAWAQDGVLVSAVPAPRVEPGGPVLVGDGAGGAIAVWMDRRDGAADANLFAQRLTAGGGAAWAPNGIHVTDAPGAQGPHVALPDGAGGATVLFDDRRTAAMRRISGQRVLPDGTLP